MILIVEDNADSANLLTLYFRMRDKTAVVMTSGKDAIDFLQVQMPKAILLDYHMPGMDGVTLIKEIRSDPRLASTPIFMITGDMRITNAFVRGAGATGLYHKGRFEWEDLVRDVLAAIGE
jgi:CheY-like chemotaxis protein